MVEYKIKHGAIVLSRRGMVWIIVIYGNLGKRSVSPAGWKTSLMKNYINKKSIIFYVLLLDPNASL